MKPTLEDLKSRRSIRSYRPEQIQPEELEAVAEDAEGREIMAVRHRKYPVYGLQFHPESIMTPEGSKILENFLSIA